MQPPINFVLNRFSSSYTMTTLATVDDPIDGILDASATAVFYISQTDIQSVFQAQVDSEDMNDISYTDIHYMIFMDRWPNTTVLNPVNGMMDQPLSWNPILNVGIPNKMLVKHDFLRYLSSKLFNTPQGVDLFNNESILISSLDTLGNYAYQNDISYALWKYATTASTPVSSDINQGFIIDPKTGLKATTGDMPTDANLCYIITNKLLQVHPDRFKNLTVDSNGLFSIPILAGDTINFLTQINPVSSQNNLTGVPVFGGRTYQIKLVIDDGSHTNTISID